MNNNTKREECIQTLIDLMDSNEDIEITRDYFIKNTDYSKHFVRKEFGTFSGLKRIAQDTSASTLNEKDEEKSSKEERNNDDEEDTASEDDLKFNKSYVFNPNTQTYVFLFNKKSDIGENIVLSKSKVDKILKLYSNFDHDPATINEVSRSCGLPRNVVIHVLKALNITHDSLPFSEEDYIENEEEDLVGDLVESKKFSVYQSFQKQSWKNIQEDANKWSLFQENLFNPLKDFLDNWTPPEFNFNFNINSDSKRRECEGKLLVTLNDTHFGQNEKKDNLYGKSSKDCNIDLIESYVDDYLDQINNFLEFETNYLIDEITLVLMGDLVDSLNGFTDKGTKLGTYPLNEELVKRSFESIFKFTVGLSKLVSKVNVKSVQGNHTSLGDWLIAFIMNKVFEATNTKDINVENSTSRWLDFNVYDSYFVVEHGYSHLYKSKVPSISNSDKLDNYVKDVLLENPTKIAKAKHKYFLTADVHHNETKEFKHFESFVMPALVPSSRFANNSNLNSRQRQICLLITEEEGVKSTHNFYFDK